MKTEPQIDFSEEQWQFLATMAIFKDPVPIDLLGELAPLLPGPLFELIRCCKKRGWMVALEDDVFGLTENLPQNIRDKIQEINKPDRLANALEVLSNSDQLSLIDPEFLISLYIKTGNHIKALSVLIELATSAFDQGKPKDSLKHLESIIDICPLISPATNVTTLFLSMILKASDLSMAMGMLIPEITPVLEQGRRISEQVGDQRSRAIVYLHLGRAYYVSNRRSESQDALSLGKSLVEELGDDDIMEQANEFLGIHFFQQGLFTKAIEYFEQAIQAAENNQRQALSLAAMMLGTSISHTGQFHRAIGILDSYWHRARQDKNMVMATILEASLASVLLKVNKKKEALAHLEHAHLEAREQQNGWGLWLASGLIAVYHHINSNISESIKAFESYLAESEKSGMLRHFVSPLALELTAFFEQAGYEPIPGFRFDNIYQLILQEPSIHMRGVAIRLKASFAIARKTANKKTLADLEQSVTCLLQSGDPVQLAKTHAEIARYYAYHDDINLAQEYAQKARRGLPETISDRFPEELKFLLNNRGQLGVATKITEQSLEESFRIIEELIPRPNFDELLGLLVAAMTRLFKAERCGLFWFKGRKAESPVLQSAINLFKADTESIGFRRNLMLILEAFRSNRPIQERQANNQSKTEVNRKPAILCLPFALKGQPKGVLYLDNSYLENCFDNIKAEFLNHLSDRLGKYIERIEEYSRFINRPRTQPVAYDAVVETGGTGTILSRDRKMNRILTQADRVAKTGATVLILGETGVGKEVLARWIHQKSHRNSEGSLVVIDPTTMPENLVESELFGHEKGAFTGAISQKSGRLELAHKGTLFIDEIGEISESIQVKLLRVIQEKSFTRVGGTKSIASDFRLLAATNRNLPAEVEAGRFRKDLYYRLNVMEFSIPPLRKRSDDIIQLANLFLATYARKYDRPGLRLSIENETVLKAYQWPGNIRELKNIIERAVLMSEQDELELNLVSDLGAPQANPFDDNPSFAEIQKRYITHVLSQTNNRISEAAKILKMNRSTLYTRIKKLGI